MCGQRVRSTHFATPRRKTDLSRDHLRCRHGYPPTAAKAKTQTSPSGRNVMMTAWLFGHKIRRQFGEKYDLKKSVNATPPKDLAEYAALADGPPQWPDLTPSRGQHWMWVAMGRAHRRERVACDAPAHDRRVVPNLIRRSSA